MKEMIPLNLKRLTILGLVWVVFVVAWVILFSPYGSRISSREWSELTKLLLTPPVALFVLNYLLAQFIKSK